MDVRRRSTNNSKPRVKFIVDERNPKVVKASDALPLPLYLTNFVFFILYFYVVGFLLTSWSEKIQTNIALHILLTLDAGDPVSLIGPVLEVVVAHKVFDEMPAAEDEEIIEAVVNGTILSYSLESKLRDCKKRKKRKNRYRI